MNDNGYTIMHRPHACPKPTERFPIGTLIRCNECGRKWEQSFFGWVRVEDKREEG